MHTSIVVPWDGLPRLVRNFVPSPNPTLTNVAPSGASDNEMIIEANRWIREAHTKFAPPLEAADVFGVCTYALYSKHFVEKWREIEGYRPGDNDIRCKHRCALIVAEANPNYAMYAGMYRGESLDGSKSNDVVANYFEWKRTTMRPAMMGNRESARMEALGIAMDIMCQVAWRTDPARNYQSLCDAWIDNVGGNEKDARDREEAPPGVVVEVVNLLFAQGMTEYHHVKKGRLVIDAERLGEHLSVISPRGTQARANVRLVADQNLRDCISTEADPAFLAELRELRSVLNVRRHRLVARALDGALSRPHDPEAIAAARRVGTVARQIESFAAPIQAAFIYELFKESVSQSAVAHDYGVSTKQLRVALDRVAHLLPRRAA